MDKAATQSLNSFQGVAYSINQPDDQVQLVPSDSQEISSDSCFYKLCNTVRRNPVKTLIIGLVSAAGVSGAIAGGCYRASKAVADRNVAIAQSGSHFVSNKSSELNSTDFPKFDNVTKGKQFVQSFSPSDRPEWFNKMHDAKSSSSTTESPTNTTETTTQSTTEDGSIAPIAADCEPSIIGEWINHLTKTICCTLGLNAEAWQQQPSGVFFTKPDSCPENSTFSNKCDETTPVKNDLLNDDGRTLENMSEYCRIEFFNSKPRYSKFKT